MTRCKHEHIVLSEVGHSNLRWYIQDGKVLADDASVSDMEPIISIKCYDCNKLFRFNQFSTDLPNWVNRLLEVREEYSRFYG